MEEKTNALMIKSVDYGENDKILTLFTPDMGVISAKIRGVKKAGAKLKFAAEPFSFCEYVLVGRDLKSVANASLHDGFYPLRLDVGKYYAAAVVAEFARRFCPENLSSPALFFKSVETLGALAYGGGTPSAALIDFLFAAVAGTGYAIDAGACAVCGGEIGRPFFDFSTGTVVCENCRREDLSEIRASTYRLLVKLSRQEPADADEQVCRRALHLMAKYIKINTAEELSSLNDFLALDL